MTVTVSPAVATSSVLSFAATYIEVKAVSVRSIFSMDPKATWAVAAQALATPRPLLIRDLGWTEAEAAAIRAQLATFEEDWDAPGMDAYDAL